MKRWAILTILLYFICLSILVVPLFILVALKEPSVLQIIKIFYIWFVPVLVLVEGVLLLVPVDIVRERPIKRRKIFVSAVVVSIPMVALTIGFFVSIALMIWGEDAVGNSLYNWFGIIIIAILWLIWGIIFFKSYTKQSPISFIPQLTKWLLRGSILELLVAIPSHIISRHRDECCAPIFSLYGIATGLAIALMSFGPGVFILFAKRIKNKKGKKLIAPCLDSHSFSEGYPLLPAKSRCALTPSCRFAVS